MHGRGPERVDSWIDVIDHEVVDESLSQEGDTGASSSCVGFDVAGTAYADVLDDVGEEPSQRGLPSGVAQRG